MSHLSEKLALAGIAALHLLCTNTPVTGPSTEEGNPQIIAIVVDSLKQPVAGISVSAYRSASKNDSVSLNLSETGEIAKKRTDQSGKCSFDGLIAGNYSLIAADSVNKRSALKSNIVIEDDSSLNFTDTLKLEQTGAIRGIVSRGGITGSAGSQNVNLQDGGISVVIQETGKSTTTPPTGAFDLPDLPSGIYTIFYYASDGFFTTKQTVEVEPGGTTNVDTIILEPIPRLLPPSDFTGIYHATTSTVTLTWQSVDYDSLRWYEVVRIDIDGPFDTSFTTEDTLLIDIISAIPSGTVLNYIVRTIDIAFNESDNAGPVEITVEE